MSGSEDEREDFGAVEEHSLLRGKLASLPLKKVHLSLSLELAEANVSLELAMSSLLGPSVTRRQLANLSSEC